MTPQAAIPLPETFDDSGFADGCRVYGRIRGVAYLPGHVVEHHIAWESLDESVLEFEAFQIALRTRSRNRVDSRGEADVVHGFTLAVLPALSRPDCGTLHGVCQ